MTQSQPWTVKIRLFSNMNKSNKSDLQYINPEKWQVEKDLHQQF